ncbi:hypothetical protein RIF29_38569 [Crotalaria pallida]|uniref:Uncharacterized protein n=1 Tax=Crotalaria pallida TaxID=3830 RepID=A0AAN9E2J2_CROPI
MQYALCTGTSTCNFIHLTLFLSLPPSPFPFPFPSPPCYRVSLSSLLHRAQTTELERERKKEKVREINQPIKHNVTFIH